MAIVLITGGAGGIGSTVAEQLAARGDTPVCADLDGQAAQQAAARIPGADWLHLDVSDAAACRGAVEETVRRHGAIDGLVTCAAVFGWPDVDAVTPEDLHTTLAVNVHGTFFTCQAAAAAMRAAGTGGSIVVFSSGAARVALGSPLYSASKAAVEALARDMALAWGTDGIRVNGVSPGVIDTEMSSVARNTPEILEALMAHTPLRRVGLPGEVASTVAFLLSDAASYITGAIVPADGGFLAV